jgi:hypothetical protein
LSPTPSPRPAVFDTIDIAIPAAHNNDASATPILIIWLPGANPRHAADLPNRIGNEVQEKGR